MDSRVKLTKKQTAEFGDEEQDGFTSHAVLASKNPHSNEDKGKTNTRAQDTKQSKKHHHHHGKRHEEEGNVVDFLRPSAQKRKVANMFYQSKNESKKVATLSMFFNQSPSDASPPVATTLSNNSPPVQEPPKIIEE